jgi:hypothetical protein
MRASDAQGLDRESVVFHLFAMAVALGLGAMLLGSLSICCASVALDQGHSWGLLRLYLLQPSSR